MTSFVPLDEVISRKRKQEPGNLSDYVYSSPNSPSHTLNLSTDVMDHGYPFGVDPNLTTFEYSSATDYSSFAHHQHSTGLEQFNNNSGLNSRRHSVAIGEMDYHYHSTFNMNKGDHLSINTDHHLDNLNNNLPFMKQEPLDEMNWDSTDFQHLFGGTSLPSSFSSHSSGTTFDTLDQPATHQRTLSLRLENLPSLQQHQDHGPCASPTTPVFFSPTFLDSLKTEEEGNNFNTNPSIGSTLLAQSIDHQYQYPPTHHQQQQEHDIDLSTGYIVHPDQLAMQLSVQQQQQQKPSGLWLMDSTSSTKRQSVSKRRSSTKTIKQSPPSSPATTTSTCSPSPPITPSQHVSNFESSFHHTHPSIPEEDDDMVSKGAKTITDDTLERHAERRVKNSLVSARIVQGAISAAQLKPLIQQYLLSDDPSSYGEHSVTLLTSRVAQKSYGTEKRFLCPPPTTILSGASWWTTTGDQDELATSQFYSPSANGDILCPPKLTIHISGEPSSHDGTLEWSYPNGSVIDNGTPSLAAAARASSLGETTISGKCVSKQLHINDADEKRRRVEVMAKIQLGNGLYLGTLTSKGIKVISKPSKKRQSLKNMELCIHHGTTVSLFNRIRSQTVSTKYLGVSNDGDPSGNGNAGTCFVARTGSWDPFVVWIVDTSRSPESASSTPPGMPHHPLNPDFPPPPAIALQSGISLQSPVAVHYNQPVVLQCVSTGLVSPVMVIRKVDKGSTVLGGNRVEDLSGVTGGECGDEAIGDPVSQLHKIAFQIIQDPSVAYNNKATYKSYHHQQQQQQQQQPISSDWTLPRTSHSVTYLACLNDVVGMHKTTSMRTLVSSKPPSSPTCTNGLPPWNMETPSSSLSTPSLYNNNKDPTDVMATAVVSSQIEPAGKVVRKRRVSCDVVKSGNLIKYSANNNNSMAGQRRRVNSLNDVPTKMITGEGTLGGRRSSLADRRLSSDNGNPVDGSCWTEDVSDAAVWTIVGTDVAKYTFWTPPSFSTAPLLSPSSSSSSSSSSQDIGGDDLTTFNNPFTRPQQSHPITPFPIISHINSTAATTMLITGENLTRDLSAWFGDIKAPLTEYKSRELLACHVPEECELASSLVANPDEECPHLRKLPLLLVRGDGVVYRTGQFYTF
ncbi:hypothetical protein BC941DRAFT_497633 [Chlamydoabsidia padenii]|nr:hypothetical protein BC941DRAFT_497633 [Chlamydoabsidia padenii]